MKKQKLLLIIIFNLAFTSAFSINENSPSNIVFNIGEIY